MWARFISRLLGAGFNSFWSGDRLAVVHEKLGIIQAHNGYLETYLNGGVIGVALLLIVLVTASKRIQREIVQGDFMARGRFAIVVLAFLYNLTEAAFNKMGLVWFLLLLAVVRYRMIDAKVDINKRVSASESRQLCHQAE
jgi:O-antigen ligase